MFLCLIRFPNTLLIDRVDCFADCNSTRTREPHKHAVQAGSSLNMWVACGVRSRPAPEYPYVYTKPTSASGIAHPSSQRRGLGIPDRLTNSIRNAMFGLSKLLQQHTVNRLSFFAKKRPPIDRFGLSFSLEYRAWKWNMATAKPRKRIKYSQQWKDSYRDKYPCLEQYCYRDLTGKKVVDNLRATCTICKCDFGISHGVFLSGFTNQCDGRPTLV